jgi:hypothetical protein
MDSDDEEMCDASSSAPASPGGGAGEGEFEEEEAAGDVEDGQGAGEAVMVMEVVWFQVDLDYEFDAPRWFDLAQEEPPPEAAAAQAWFASAPSCPPSRACPPRLEISGFVFRVSGRGSVDRVRV